MKIIRFWLALLAALVSQQVFAQAQLAPEKGWYAGFALGRTYADIDIARIDTDIRAAGFATSTTTFDKQDTGAKLYIGYQFNRHIAVEGGYALLGKYRGTTVTTGPAANFDSEVKARALYADLVGILPLTDRFSLTGSLGLSSTDAKARVNSGNISSTGSADDSGGKFGVGARYDITPQVGMRLDLERFASDLSMVSLGLQIRF